MSLIVYRAELLSIPDDPGVAGAAAIRHHRDGLLAVADGLIVAFGAWAELAPLFATAPVIDHRPGLIVPGFVDTHIHYPQTDRIAAHGAQLLDWLERHIFPAEAAFADKAHGDEVAAFFLDELLRNGTTTALVFGTVHAASVDALFEAADDRAMRLIAGKVLMDRGPATLCDSVAEGRADTERLIARWHGHGRLGYAITPRFALTSSDEQLADSGRLLAEHPTLLLQTHLSENRDEVAAVAARFGEDRDYLAVYERFGLVGPRTVLAHGIHLDDGALARIRTAGAGIAFCPTSNLFLGSGLFDLARAEAQGVKIGIGTDIGAGTRFSLLATLGEAYKVGRMQGEALDPFRALHLATAGGAALLGLGDRIGALQPGQDADFIVLDLAATPLLARRTAGQSLHDRLFVLTMLADDRAVSHSYVAGRLRHVRQ